MPIKRSEELFGDDAAHGPRANIDEVPAQGLGAANRAVGFGEMFTSGAANRATYALALNDDQLDDRITVFEEGGLDTVYRLGLTNDAGGGRIINVDGGAVEVVSALSSNLTADRANALLRADTQTDTANGSVGFDFVARNGGVSDPGSGKALFGVLDRRSLILNTSTAKLSASVAATLHAGGAAADTVTLTGAPGTAFWCDASGNTALVPGLDLVDILTGPYVGLYVLAEIQTQGQARLRTLGGAAPSFAPASAATLRVYRPSLSSAGGQGVDRASAGVVVAGLPGDANLDGAALTLVPGGRAGTSSIVTEQGARYALRVRVLPPKPSEERGIVGITARGSFVTESFANFDPEARLAKDLRAGFRFLAPPGSGGPAIGFAALHQDTTQPAYPAVLQARVGEALSGTFDGSGSVTVLQAELGDRMPAQGSLVELFLTAGLVSLGVFKIGSVSVGDPNTYLSVRSFDNATAYPYPPPPALDTVSVVVQFLQGVVVGSDGLVGRNSSGGSMLVDPMDSNAWQPDSYSKATLFAQGPYDPAGADFSNPYDPSHINPTPTALHVANVSNDPKALLIRGMDRQNDDSFFVTAAGWVVARKGFYSPAGAMVAPQFLFPQPVEFVERVIPQSTWLASGSWKRESGFAVPSSYSLSGSCMGYSLLTMPVSGFLPHGATLTSFAINYYTTASWTQAVRFALVKLAGPESTRSNVEGGTFPAWVAGLPDYRQRSWTLTEPIVIDDDYQIEVWIENTYSAPANVPFNILRVLVTGSIPGP